MLPPEVDTALHFGGGKDSLATLYLMRARWPNLVVVWMNTGAAFEETRAQMAAVAAMVPHFLEVRSDVIADIAEHGWPVDVVPVSHTALGKQLTGAEGPTLRPWTECCASNIWLPMYARMRELGIKRIIRGQRNDEPYRNRNLRDGLALDGFIYEFPLAQWSEDEVFRYLDALGVGVPAYYDEVKSSLDCWCCTAFLDVKDAQVRYLQRHHPERYTVVAAALAAARDAVADASAPLMEEV